MTLASSSVGTQREVAQMGAVQMESLGRAGSQRSVQLVTVNGMLNQRMENDITTSIRFFSFVTRVADGSVMSVNRRSFQATRPLNFFAPGVRWATRGSVTGVMCIFSPRFTAHLTQVERDLNFDKVDVLTSIDSRSLVQLGHAMLRETLSPSFGGALLVDAMGMQTALEIARCDGARRRDEASLRVGLAPWQVRRLEDYVCAHLADDLTLGELAELLDMSVRHLSRMVRHAKGKSVHRWVAELRVAEAQRLLSETNLPLGEIAGRVSFGGARTFSKAFRIASGFSPTEYRCLVRALQ